MLDAHPDLAIPPETGFVAAIALRPDMELDDVFQTITRYPPDAPVWEDFHLEAGALREHLERPPVCRAADALRIFYSMYAARFGKTRWGDKTPTHALRMIPIAGLLPEARFIHLIRDGRDAVVSLRRQWFAPARDIAALAADWRDFVTKTRADGRRLPHFLEVSFESLLANPEAELRRICEFIELPFHPAMLRHHERAEQRLGEHVERRRPDGSVVVTAERRRAQQASSRRPPDPGCIGQWRTGLTEQEKILFAGAAGDLIDALGYKQIERAPQNG